MYNPKEEIILIVSVGTFLMLLLAVFIMSFLFFYQKRYNQHQKDLDKVKEKFEQELLQTQLEIKEQTLQNIAQEIHDNIGQVLSLAKLNLNTLPSVEDPQVIAKLATTKELVSKAIHDLRNLSKTLDSDAIGQAGLYKALQFEMEQIEKIGSFTTRVQLKGTERHLGQQKEIIIFRMAQEALNNVIKHAKAQTIIISVTYMSQQFMLSIADDGQGFDLAAHQQKEVHKKGSGLRNMYNRAKLIGAELTVQSVPGQGTVTSLQLPLPN